MAEKVILAEQELTFTDSVAELTNPVPFALGETYKVIFDETEYTCDVQEVPSGMDMVGTLIGNGSGFGLDGNDEPFMVAYDREMNASAVILVYFSSEETHTIAIYQTVEDEPQKEVGIVIKNYSGIPIEYKGVEKVMFNTADGGKRVYSKGEALEDVSIELDFSSGDMTVKSAEGTLVKSAVIKKPDTLVAENIAEGIDIAGIIGTLAAGGGGGKLVVKTGEFKPTTYSHTVTHGLGTVPIFARLMPTTGFPSETNVSVLYFVDGISTELANMAGMTERLQYGAYMNSYRKQLSQFASSYGIDYTSTSLAIANANANAITFGSESYRLTTARTWSWLVVGFETTE